MYDNLGARVFLKDDSEAVKWYRMAAEQGLAMAQFNLGITYGIEDEAEAVNWYRLAAEQGYANADSLGNMYASGRGVIEDEAAENWYRLAAEQGNADAQFNLGVAYANGQGVPHGEGVVLKGLRRSREMVPAGNAEANGPGYRRRARRATSGSCTTYVRQDGQAVWYSRTMPKPFMYAKGKGGMRRPCAGVLPSKGLPMRPPSGSCTG